MSTYSSDGARRVLLVEDSPSDAAMVEAALADVAPGEFAILRVTTLAEASLELARGGVICVLLDLGLPDAERLDGLHRILEQAPGIPVVILTGTDNDVVGLLAIVQGAQDFLVKGDASGRTLARSIRFAIARTERDHRRAAI